MSKTLKDEQDLGQVYNTRGRFPGGTNISKGQGVRRSMAHSKTSDQLGPVQWLDALPQGSD